MKTKKILSWLLALAMVFGMMPAVAMAESNDDAAVYADDVYAVNNDTNVTYVSLADAVEDGGNIKLLKDVTMTGTMVVSKDTVLDLGGNTITNVGGTSNHTFRVAANMTVKNGTIDNTAGGYCFIVGYNTPQAGNLTVESGNYYGNTSVVSVTYGTVNIEGGYFKATPYNGNYIYTINCVDRFYEAGQATVCVTGGSFTGFDPSNSAGENPKASFVADGCIVTTDNSTPVVYTVVDNREAENTTTGVKYATLAGAVAAANSGDTIILLDDVTLSYSLYLDNKTLTIEGGDHFITAGEGFKTNSTETNASVTNGQYELLKLNNSNVTLRNVELVTTTEAKNALDICNSVAVLVNVTLNHANAEKGAPLIVNGSDVTIQGTFNITTGATSWYGINVAIGDTNAAPTYGKPKLTFDSNVQVVAEITGTGNADYPRGFIAAAEGAAVSVTGGTFTGTYGDYFANLKCISGGTFAVDPTDYLVEGKIAKKSGTQYEVVANSGLTSGTYMSVPSVAAGYTYTGEAAPYTVVPATYTVTWVVDGEETTETLSYGAEIELPTAPEKTGYTFAGWEGYTEGMTVPVDGVTFTAKWTAKQFTVTWNVDGETTVMDYAYGATIVAPANPTKTGYTFAGWEGYTEGMAMPAEDLTFTATWDVSYIPPVVPPSIPTTPSEPETPTEPETETTVNPDGSTTTTVTDTTTGTVTETTENVDGTTTEVKTESDGTVTTTTTATTTETTEEGAAVTTETKVEEKVAADGTVTNTNTTTTTTETAEKKETVEEKVETVVAEDGTETTTTTKKTDTELADGTKATTTVDTAGTVTAEVVIPAEVAQTSETVALPIPAVTTTKDSAAAATITVTTNTTEDTAIEVPVENVSAGTVLVIVEEDGTETVVTETKLTENGVVADLPDGATVKVVDNSKDFNDVDENDWYKDAVDFVSARGIVSGMTEEEYGHNNTATRAMLWTMLARMDGVDTEAGDGKWYEIGQQWAIENGISDGTNPGDAITREQLVTMLWRYVGEPHSDHDIGHFEDHHETSDWAYAAKRWANENGIINGMGGKLNPQGETTRAMLAQFIKNFIEAH